MSEIYPNDIEVSEEILGVFSSKGRLSQILNGYRYRESQTIMAELVRLAIDEEKFALIEAGTGTGKSFAYLAPIIMKLSEDSSKRAVIATSTNTLLRQLYKKDIPFLLNALGVDVRVSTLYGRGNYVCKRKFYDVYQGLLEDEVTKRAAKFVGTSESGSIQDLEYYTGLAKYFENLLSDSDDCFGAKCPYRRECFFFKARERALESQIVITNHHIVLFDAKARWEDGVDFSEWQILPPYSILVFDEAHHLEDEATEILARLYNSLAVIYYIDALKKKEAKFGGVNILNFIAAFLKDRSRERVESANEMLSALKNSVEEYQREIDRICYEYEKLTGGLLFDQEHFFTRYSSVLRKGEAIASDMVKLREALTIPLDDVLTESPYIDIARNYGFRFAEFSDNLRLFIRFSDPNKYIPYAERDSRSGQYRLCIADLEIGGQLNNILYSNLPTIIFTSATLATGDKRTNLFDYFKSSVGLSKLDRIEEASFASPFNYEHNLMLLVPEDGPIYLPKNDAAYTDYVASLSLNAIESSGGGALLLFTSKRMMNSVYDKVSERLGGEYHLLKQGSSGRMQLLEEFKRDEDSCLFATDTFWEGIDAPGNTCRLVVITKLPFKVPTDPITKARMDYLERNNLSNEMVPFMKISVPYATIRLKQGIGRLIRDEEDRGVVLVLDSRLIRKGYGRTMIKALPRCGVPEDTSVENCARKIGYFFGY